jgi:hypothetical protein
MIGIRRKRIVKDAKLNGSFGDMSRSCRMRMEDRVCQIFKIVVVVDCRVGRIDLDTCTPIRRHVLWQHQQVRQRCRLQQES